MKQRLRKKKEKQKLKKVQTLQILPSSMVTQEYNDLLEKLENLYE